MTPLEVYENDIRKPTSDMSAYLFYLRTIAEGHILEIGVRNGVSTSAFLIGLGSREGSLISVDIKDCGHLFAEIPYWHFRHCSSRDVRQVLGISEEFELGPAEIFDVVLIDGDHTPEGFAFDLHTYSQYVKDGGLILCHDIEAYNHGSSMEKFNNPEFPSERIRDIYFDFAKEHDLVHYELPGGWAGMGVLTWRCH